MALLLGAGGFAAYKFGYVDKVKMMISPPPPKEKPKELTPEELKAEEEKVAKELEAAGKEGEKGDKPLEQVLKETDFKDEMSKVRAQKRIGKELQSQGKVAERKLTAETEKEIGKRNYGRAIDEWMKRVE